MRDWNWSFRDYRRVLNLIPKDKKTQYLNGCLATLSTRYFCELNPIFLHQLGDLRFVSLAPTWLLRDGLIPLIWFFLENPNPPADWKTRFFVQSHLARYVPPSWRMHFGTYELTARVQNGKGRLLLIGLLADSHCSLKFLEEKLSGEKLAQWKDHKVSQLSFLGLNTANIYDIKGSQQTFLTDYVLKLCQHFGTGITTLTTHQFMIHNALSGFEVMELNENLICADNFLVHHALANGAKVFGIKPPLKEYSDDTRYYYPLSPFHGFEVCQSIHETEWAHEEWRFLVELQTFDRLLEKNTGRMVSRFKSKSKCPWPTFLLDWARHQVS